jgi:hypothetical protein
MAWLTSEIFFSVQLSAFCDEFSLLEPVCTSQVSPSAMLIFARGLAHFKGFLLSSFCSEFSPQAGMHFSTKSIICYSELFAAGILLRC